MRKLVLFLLFFLLAISIVNAQDVGNYSSLKIQIDLNSGIAIDSKGEVKSLETKLSFYPKDDDTQKITLRELKAAPEAEISEKDNELIYSWKKGVSGNIEIKNLFLVDNKINFKKINGKIAFPLKDDNSEKEYLQSTNLIIVDEKIRKKAGELAVGNWVRENINYSLDSLTEEATQNSVWVLENKEGVCDELTVLYIAMMRSLGIPAKFVSGTSYTNIGNTFGNHAWAELYFPGYGWVAFDVTYGQLGWVDAGHVKMDESFDARKSSISYAWRTSGGDVKPGKLDVKANIVEFGGKRDEKIGLNVEILNNKVKGDSYVPVKVEVENKQDYYLPVNLYLVRGPKIIEDNERIVLLKPREKRNVFFLIDVPGDLKQNVMYTSEIKVKTSTEDYDEDVLEYSGVYDFGLNKKEAEDKIGELSKEEVKSYSKDVEIKCSSGKDVYYVYELSGNITCEIRNIGNKNLDNLHTCFLDDCRNIDLTVAEKKELLFIFNISKAKNELQVIVQGDGITRNVYAPVKILERPGIKVTGLSYPKTINYNDEGKINFVLSSRDEIENLKIFIDGQEVFTIEKFVNVNEFNIPFQGDFFLGKEKKLKVTYEDRNEAVYEYSEDLDITIEDVPWYARILNFFKGIGG